MTLALTCPPISAEQGLRPADVYGSAGGAIEQLEALEAWFAVQRDFHFYSSSGGVASACCCYGCWLRAKPAALLA